MSGMNDLLTRLWRLGKPFQWRFLWLMHAKFICGVTGVIRDGYHYLIEVYYEATLVGGLGGLALDGKEVLEARLFTAGNLPDGMPDAHRHLAIDHS